MSSITVPEQADGWQEEPEGTCIITTFDGPPTSAQVTELGYVT